jgi:hypothetical protein
MRKIQARQERYLPSLWSNEGNWNVYSVTLSALLEAEVEEVLRAEPSWANSC